MDKAFFDVAEGVRKVIEELTVPKEKRDRFEKFSERARRILSFSEEEAIRLRHLYIGTEHLLLGLLREGQIIMYRRASIGLLGEGQIIMYGHRSMALTVLEHLGIKPNKVSSEIEFLVGTGSPSLRVVIELNLGANGVVEFAVDEARHMGNHYVGSEHLLLGLLRETDSIAARVLERLGIGLEETREEVVRTHKTLQNLTWELR
jgi:ATP-dependent Clp protease ATP-binding subunit ClpC